MKSTVQRTISRLIYWQCKLVDVFDRFGKTWFLMKLSQFFWDWLWVAFGCDAYFTLSHNLAFSQTQNTKLAACERHRTVSRCSTHSGDQPEKIWFHLFFAFLRFNFVKMPSQKGVSWGQMEDLSLRNVMLLWGRQYAKGKRLTTNNASGLL